MENNNNDNESNAKDVVAALQKIGEAITSDLYLEDILKANSYHYS